MPINALSLEHTRGCDTDSKYVSGNQVHNRRDYGHCYSKPYYSIQGKYGVSGSLARYFPTPDYLYGCPKQC